MRIIDVVQGSPEWLAARCGIPTASVFDSVMATIKSGGEAAERRNLRVRLLVERLTGKPFHTYENAAMRQGKEREPLAKRAYFAKTGNMLENVGFCRHDTLETGCSPDGLLLDENGGIECKCPELSNHLVYWRLKTEPPEYRWQIQGNLWITEREFWDFVSWNPDFPEHMQLVIRRVYRDESAIQKLAGEVERFVDELVKEERAIRELTV